MPGCTTRQCSGKELDMSGQREKARKKEKEKEEKERKRERERRRKKEEKEEREREREKERQRKLEREKRRRKEKREGKVAASTARQDFQTRDHFHSFCGGLTSKGMSDDIWAGR